MPPAARTDWERSEGNGETKVTLIPLFAHSMAHERPDIPLPIIKIFFIASLSTSEYIDVCCGYNDAHNYKASDAYDSHRNIADFGGFHACD